MTIALKPCKFCCCEATIRKYSIIGTPANLYIVRCTNPKCSNSKSTSACYLSEEAAVRAWNEENDEAAPVDYLKRLQPIQPELKEGHWIDKGWNGDWAWQTDGRGNCWRVIVCSECRKNVSTESNYCPHCGAKMKGVGKANGER